ncbi:Class V chitinase CHIT5 [Linum grandiflorum]
MASSSSIPNLQTILIIFFFTLFNTNSQPISPNPSPSPTPQPPPQSPSAAPPPADIIRAAYWESFSDFPASSINTSHFTHVYYAFILLEPTTFRLNITESDKIKLPQFTSALSGQTPPVRTLLSIGGAFPITIAQVFAEMAKSRETRAVFILSAIRTARKYGFDGLDVDWEYPVNSDEMRNYAVLLRECRAAVNLESLLTGRAPLLLTSAVYYASKIENSGEIRVYPGRAMDRYLDWVNPMTYDYNGAWTNITGPNAALFDNVGKLSTVYGIQSWMDAGVSSRKLVLGLPLYGRTWMLEDANVNGIGSKAVAAGPGGGSLGYDDVRVWNAENKATVVYDGESVSYYSFANGSWVGYDDTVSIDLKIRFAQSKGLGGYFFWALGQDRTSAIPKIASLAW